eukprot:TRINITY_DN28883_c0_g1_i1.p1 TRINITY_DN28883_c0_g1~~TRINITY_DN28883_c0_g1_i1.p1  ORF type:complete len:809 (-),score=144.71 TRINITY_DN28883_c0_g1_i1:56-2245(-)
MDPAGSMSSSSGGPPSPPPIGSALPPVGGPRSKAVRLARLSPELMQRLGEDKHASMPSRAVRPEGMATFLPSELEVPPKLAYSLPLPHSLPLPRAPWDRSSLGPPTPSVRANTRLPPHRQGDPLDVSDRDRLLEGSSLRYQRPLLGGSDGSVYLKDVGQPYELDRHTASREGYIRDIDSLHRRCVQLTEVINLGRAATFPSVRNFCERSVKVEDRFLILLFVRCWRGVVSHQICSKALVRASSAEEVLRDATAEAATQRAAAAARLVEVRAEADARIATLEARIYEETSRRAAAEASQRATLEAEAARARAIRAQALLRGSAHANAEERHVHSAILRSWHAQTLLAREALCRKAAEVEALAASERATEAEAQLRQSPGRLGAFAAGARQRGGVVASGNADVLLLGDRDAGGSSTSTSAGTSGLKLSLLAAASRVSLHAVLVCWRTVVCQRRNVGLLQAKLFAEEAHREAALTKQRREQDARILVEEAQHREMVDRFRLEISTSEARHAEAFAAQEMEAAQRLAGAEADFLRALQQAITQPVTEEGDAAALLAAVQSEDPGGGRGGSDGTEPGTISQAAVDARIASAVRSMRASSDARLADIEVRQSEGLQRERERSVRLLAEAERLHLEAFRRVSQEADRRVTEAEDRQLEALTELQHSNDQRLREIEARHSRTLLALQGSLIEDMPFDDSVDLAEYLGENPIESEYCTSNPASESGEVYGSDGTPRGL